MDSVTQIPVPAILYHYTTQEGFLGIIQSKSLWATDMRYLNDRREYLAGMELLAERVTRSVERSEPGSRQALFLEKLQQRLANIWGQTFYVASFSEDGDLLSQWRGYSGGAGFALGFRGESLVEQLRTRGWTLAQCVYDPDQQVALIDQMLSASMALLHHPKPAQVEEQARPGPVPKTVPAPSFNPEELFPLPPRTAPEWMDAAFPQLISAFFLNGPRIKDAAFREEKEWRAISSLDSCGSARVRAGAGILRPYVPLGLDSALPLQLAELVVGPGGYQDLAREAAEAALQQHQVPCERVRLSRVPYRSW